MAPLTAKRRRVEDEVRRPKKKIRIKKQAEYHSSSEDEDAAPLLDDDHPPEKRTTPKPILKAGAPAPSKRNQDEEEAVDGFEGFDEAERNAALNAAAVQDDTSENEDVEEQNAEDDMQLQDDDESDAESEDDMSMTSSQAAGRRKKRNDPDAFATSISRILDTKLTTAKRQDPVLSRSKSASEANKAIADNKLEAAAKAQLKAEKKQALEKGRVKDVLALDDPNVNTGKVQEEERRLKKTAQRGVVKLFNAVRAAQVKAEEGMKQAREEGVVGLKQREDRVQEMSKEGFLELISRGGGAKPVTAGI